MGGVKAPPTTCCTNCGVRETLLEDLSSAKLLPLIRENIAKFKTRDEDVLARVKAHMGTTTSAGSLSLFMLRSLDRSLPRALSRTHVYTHARALSVS